MPARSPDRSIEFAENKGLPVEAIGYSEFIANGKWNVDDVLRPIYEEAGQALGRTFPYPEK
jgi:ribonuclease Z